MTNPTTFQRTLEGYAFIFYKIHLLWGWLFNDKLENTFSAVDSSVVSKDTIINLKTYYKVQTYRVPENNNSKLISSKFLRDSADCIVDEEGQKLFSSINFRDTLVKKNMYQKFKSDEDSVLLYSVSCKMEKPTEKITVPAGSFEVLEFRATVIPGPNLSLLTNPSYWHEYYAENVGMVFQDMLYSGGRRGKLKLMRYHINE